MIRFPRALTARQSASFNAIVKDEIESLDIDLLPLQQGLSRTSHVSTARVSATILRVENEASGIRVKAGLFYAGIIAGCSCADDPTPVDELVEYCEVWFEIDGATAEVNILPPTDEEE
jgi:hypothetical protein